MYRRFHDRFGTAGLVVAVLALVVALAGTAFAAAGLNSKQKKQVKKIAKKFAGKPGPAGANGTNGTNGKDGASGANGKSVVASPAACGGLGGTEFEVEGSGASEEVCNGEDGTDGADGTFSTEPLPPGETLTGVWGVSGSTTYYTSQTIPISFPITVDPPPTALLTQKVAPLLGGGYEGHELKDGEWTYFGPNPLATTTTEHQENRDAMGTVCKGNPSSPQAEPGYLCIYLDNAASGIFSYLGAAGESQPRYQAADPSGVVFPINASSETGVRGAWAVAAAVPAP